MNELFTKNPIVGAPLTPSLMRAMNSAIRRNRPIAGKGVRISYTVGGAIISAQPSSGGIGAANILFPFKCEPYDHFPEETPEEKAEREAKGEPLKPDFEGYRFYVPRWSLMMEGKEVDFKNDIADYREDGQSFTPAAWKVWKLTKGEGDDGEEQSDKTAHGTVFCKVIRKSEENKPPTYYAKMWLDEKHGGDPSQDQDCGCDCDCSCSCGDDDDLGEGESLAYKFPVCVVDQWSRDEEEKTEENASRVIEQYVFGEVIIDSGGEGCWAIKGGEFVNRYVWNGSQMIEGDECTTDGFADKIAAILLDNVSANVKVVAFSDIDKLNEIAKQPEMVVIPLYQFNDKGRAVIDFRNIARGGSWGMIV